MKRLCTLITLALVVMTQPSLAQESRRASVRTIRTCAIPEENYAGFPAHPVTEIPLHVTRIQVVPEGDFIEARGCGSNRDFHFVRNVGDTDGVSLYTVPLLDPSHRDFAIRIGDTESSHYFVHSAKDAYKEIFNVEFWGEERLEDVDGDGKFELMLRKISKFTCANAYRTNFVYDSDEFQTIDANIVCGR